MQLQLFLENKKIFRVGMALIVSLASLGAGMLGLIYPSIYAPILFLGAGAAAVVLIVWIIKPASAIYAVLFVVLLPIGSLPPSIHSLLNRILTVVIFGVWALNILMKRQRNFWTGTAYVMLAFLIWSLVTILLAGNLEAAITLIQTYILRFVLFIFLIPNLIRTKESLDRLFKTLALNGWVLLGFAAYTLIQEGYQPGLRFQIGDANQNAASSLILVTSMGVLWVTTQLSPQKRLIKIVLALVFVMLMVFFIIASGSRGTTLSLAITISAFLFWRPLRPWAMFCILILILAMILAPSLFTTIFQRFLIQRYDTLLGGRETLWSAAMQMIGRHPLTGVGIGNAGYSILQFLNTTSNKTYASIHNPILLVWSETGLLGIVLYLGILISAAISFTKQYLHYRNIDVDHPLIPYFAFVSSYFLGYLASWIKGGGAETAFTYFFLVALLLIPSGLDYDLSTVKDKNGARQVLRK